MAVRFHGNASLCESRFQLCHPLSQQFQLAAPAFGLLVLRVARSARAKGFAGRCLHKRHCHVVSVKLYKQLRDARLESLEFVGLALWTNRRTLRR